MNLPAAPACMDPVPLPPVKTDPRDDARAVTAALIHANGNLKCSAAWYAKVRAGYAKR
ncbi:hypothetical protein [Aestuariivirga sp.]|uniref:hypothetical protein n=1 Tax=Aestuariivirga sp. TaxID=2650926 RepID=UPI0039E2CAED